MDNNYFKANNIVIEPIKIAFYMPPTVFCGDPFGHVGKNDMFFLLLKGEIILFIDNDFYIMKAGQFAFLPKGKKRRYFSFSNDYKVYSMSFYANADGVNLMSGLGLAERNYVLTPENFDYIVELFENSSYVEFNKKPIYNVAWSANILNIINEYSKAYNLQFNYKDTRIDNAIDYMKQNISKNITIEDLSKVVYMQPTYFIRCFKKAYGYSPMAYFKKLKLCIATELLIENNLSIDKIAEKIGIYDTSYFSRWFKLNCGVSPSEYKKRFINKVVTTE